MKTAGPHDFGSGQNHDETPSEPAIQPAQDSNDQCSSSGDYTPTVCPSTPTGDDSEFYWEVCHNVASDGGGDMDDIAEYIFQNSNAESVLTGTGDSSQLREGMPQLELKDLLRLRRPGVRVDSEGVGSLVHRPIPASLINWNTVYERLLEKIIKHKAYPHVKFSSGTCIPQRLFRQGAAIPDGATGEVIMFAMFDGKCFPATLALAGKCSLLVDEDTVPSFTKKHHLINLRIEWPGYHGWEAQIRTVGDQESPRGITRAKLVKEIAEQLKKFIEDKRNIPIDPAYVRYKVGPRGIELRHIHIASLEQVTYGSWQPRLIHAE